MAVAKREELSKLASGMVHEVIASLLERKEYMLHTLRNSKTFFGWNWALISGLLLPLSVL